MDYCHKGVIKEHAYGKGGGGFFPAIEILQLHSVFFSVLGLAMQGVLLITLKYWVPFGLSIAPWKECSEGFPSSLWKLNLVMYVKCYKDFRLHE